MIKRPTWYRLDTTTEQGRREWLDRVYSNNALITALTETELTTSRASSSMPGPMTRILETLDARDGHRLLEIGTGTGSAGVRQEPQRDRNCVDSPVSV